MDFEDIVMSKPKKWFIFNRLSTNLKDTLDVQLIRLKPELTDSFLIH